MNISKICAICILALGLCVQAGQAQSLPDSCRLNTEEFYIQICSMADRAVLDVRELSEKYEYAIPSSIAAPTPRILNTILDTMDTSWPIFLYCTYGDRSEQAAQLILRHYPSRQVFHLKKGFVRWKRLDYPVDTVVIEN